MELFNTLNSVLLSVIVGVVLFVIAVIYFANRKKPRLLDSEGKEIKVSEETRAALIQEYKLIKRRKSKFSRAKRDRISQLVEHMVEIGIIKPKEIL